MKNHRPGLRQPAKKAFAFGLRLKQFESTTLLFAACIATVLNGCGTKYSIPAKPAKTITHAPVIERPSLAARRRETTTTAPSKISPAIQPSAVPQADAPRSLPAAIALRKQAALATEAANYSRAIGLLERAIRISPYDPATFFALAENHLADHRPQQALELARRALTLNPSSDQQLALEALEQRCLAIL